MDYTDFGPVKGAWARATHVSSSPGLLLASSAPSAEQPAAAAQAQQAAASSSSQGLQDSILFVMEGVNEVQEQIRALQPLLELPEVVARLEARLQASEAREEAMRAELHRATDALAALATLVTRGGGREESPAQGAQAARKGHGVVRNFSPSQAGRG